jgi:hypothetical protein
VPRGQRALEGRVEQDAPGDDPGGERRRGTCRTRPVSRFPREDVPGEPAVHDLVPQGVTVGRVHVMAGHQHDVRRRGRASGVLHHLLDRRDVTGGGAKGPLTSGAGWIGWASKTVRPVWALGDDDRALA